jgi:putative FmdB family regulatory protein
VPTYQYRCTECGHDLEAVQSFSDAALTECPACAGRLRKVFGSIGLVFKGTGFYKTDSRAAVGGSKKERVEAASAGDKAASTTSSASGSPSGAAKETVGASSSASSASSPGTGAGSGATSAAA